MFFEASSILLQNAGRAGGRLDSVKFPSLSRRLPRRHEHHISFLKHMNGNIRLSSNTDFAMLFKFDYAAHLIIYL